jgi:hypothetical protein
MLRKFFVRLMSLTFTPLVVVGYLLERRSQRKLTDDTEQPPPQTPHSHHRMAAELHDLLRQVSCARFSGGLTEVLPRPGI